MLGEFASGSWHARHMMPEVQDNRPLLPDIACEQGCGFVFVARVPTAAEAVKTWLRRLDCPVALLG